MKAFAYVCSASALGIGIGIVFTQGIPSFDDDTFFLLVTLVALLVINLLALRK